MMTAPTSEPLPGLHWSSPGSGRHHPKRHGPDDRLGFRSSRWYRDGSGSVAIAPKPMLKQMFGSSAALGWRCAIADGHYLLSVPRVRCQLRYRRREQFSNQGVDTVTSSGGRRTEILDTAAILFASSGLRTSLKDIADACGILPGSLYHHFESKEALIVELVERYQLELDQLAKEAFDVLGRPIAEPIPERVVALGTAIAQCSIRHRAALLLTLYEPPSGAGDDLVRVTRRSSSEIEQAMFATLRAGQTDGSIRTDIDLEAMADRLCQTLQHISLGVFQDVRGGEEVPAIRCRIVLDGIVLDPRRRCRTRSFGAVLGRYTHPDSSAIKRRGRTANSNASGGGPG